MCLINILVRENVLSLSNSLETSDASDWLAIFMVEFNHENSE